MNPRYTILAASILALTTSYASAVNLSIVSDKIDARVQEDGSIADSSVDKLRVGDSGLDGVVVYMMKLPELAPGEIIGSAEFTVGLLNVSNEPAFSVDLYGLGYSQTATLSGSEFFQGAFGTDAGAVGIQEGFMNGASVENSIVSTSLQGSANLTTYLNDLYQTGAVAGNFAVLRLNVDLANAGSYQFWELASSIYKVNNDYASRPRINIETAAVPEPATTAAFFGAAAFGLVVLRRRLKR